MTYAHFLHQIPKNLRVSVLEGIENEDPKPHFQLWLLDSDGSLLFSQNQTDTGLDWKTLPKPNRIYGVKTLETDALVQLDDAPSQYLLVKARPRPNNNRMFIINSLSLVAAVILGTTLSFFILFYSLRQKARLADSVITELRNGNLKARFPITKMDEAGLAMLRFNKMADEIERLVERLKDTEKSRMSILQELAHDLRTPVASLRTTLETLSTRGDSIPKDLRTELTTLSLNEVDYFEHLVEDLLFLAQANDPQYTHDTKAIDLKSIIESAAEGAEQASWGKRIAIKNDFSDDIPQVKGDAHLLKRLFRNAVDNGISYARSEVTVKVKGADGARVECVIGDDGPGFSEEALREFGKRKLSRKFVSANKGRVSIGLGSVIMERVVSLHRGQIYVKNKVAPDGKILGGEVHIILPV
jgi:signal transduction histidine kinase